MRLPTDAALLVIDMQGTIGDPRWTPPEEPDAAETVARLLAAWRAAGLPIVHARRDAVDPRSPCRPGGPGHAFLDAAAPGPGEVVLGRSATSAFADGALDRGLTAAGVTTLVVCGAPRGRSIEASVRSAGELGYRVFLVADACRAAGRVAAEHARIVDCAAAVSAARLAAFTREARRAGAARRQGCVAPSHVAPHDRFD